VYLIHQPPKSTWTCRGRRSYSIPLRHTLPALDRPSRGRASLRGHYGPREFPGLVSNRLAALSSHTCHGDHSEAEANLEPPHADDPPLASRLPDTPFSSWILPLPPVAQPALPPSSALATSAGRLRSQCIFTLSPKTNITTALLLCHSERNEVERRIPEISPLQQPTALGILRRFAPQNDMCGYSTSQEAHCPISYVNYLPARFP
jgi:hypothetical protein